MDLKQIKWNQVSRFSQLIAIVLFVGVFVLGFYLGKTYEYHAFLNALETSITTAVPKTTKPIADVVFSCTDGKSIHAVFMERKVDLELSDGRTLSLPQAIAASGARYANADESFVFWNKGDTAFITEGKNTTYQDCATKPLPQ